MNELTLTFAEALGFMNALVSSVVVILAFSLLAYTLTYNFRHPVAKRFAFLLGLVMITYASEVALTRAISADSATKWLHFQWLGIALLPGAYYTFSYSILRTTNYHTDRRRLLNYAISVLSVVSAFLALFSSLLVDYVEFDPLLSYLHPGILFWPFAALFAGVVILSHFNIWMARQRCLTAESRKRMTYLLLASAAPGIGTFPYLIALGKSSVGLLSPEWILALAIVGNSAIGTMLIILNYTVAFFGVYTPDRVVRHRLIRYFARGPVVAILVILAVQTIPTVEHILGLPRNIVLFSVITGVIIAAQVVLSVSRVLTDRLVYGEDREEIAWLRELDRRLLTTTDLRQFLENHLTMLCEILRVPSGFVAAVIGTDLILEAIVGPEGTRQEILDNKDWSDALNEALNLVRKNGPPSIVGPAKGVDGRATPSANGEEAPQHLPASQPAEFGGYWLWPVLEPASEREGAIVVGMLGVRARTDALDISADELSLLGQQIESVAMALQDRTMQLQIMVALRRIIPGIDRIQQIRGIVPYVSENTEVPASELLEPSPIHNPEFESWVKEALSHYWGGPKLTRSPLMQLRVVDRVIEEADGNPGKALRLVLGRAIQNLRPGGKQDLSTPEWLLFNILEMRFIQGRKVRDIAGRLAISESDLYRKQRVAIGQVAQVLTEMEQGDWGALLKMQEEDSAPIEEQVR